MIPSQPAPCTDSAVEAHCSNKMQIGAGNKCTDSLLTTSMTEEHAPKPSTAKTTAPMWRSASLSLASGGVIMDLFTLEVNLVDLEILERCPE